MRLNQISNMNSMSVKENTELELDTLDFKSPSNEYQEQYQELVKINEKVKLYQLYLKNKPHTFIGYRGVKAKNEMSNDLKRVSLLLITFK